MPPLTAKKLSKIGKRGEKSGKKKKKKGENQEEKGQNREGSFILPLLTNTCRAGYATAVDPKMEGVILY